MVSLPTMVRSSSMSSSPVVSRIGTPFVFGENTIESPVSEAMIAARNDPGPESSEFETVRVVACRLGERRMPARQTSVRAGRVVLFMISMG